MRAARSPRGLGALVVLAAGLTGVAVAAAPAGADPAAPPATAVGGLGWGSDTFGQLGPRSTGTFPRPVPVTLPAGTSALSLGQDFTLAQSGTTLLAWGRNDEGQLGDGTRVGRTDPVTVPVPAVRAVSADERHAVVVTTDGAVYAWGDNSAGELGDGTTTDRDRPVRVTLPTASPAVAVGTGSTHTLVATADGAVYAWGQGSSGQLGRGSTASSTSPVAVRLPAGSKVTALAAGSRHSLALTSTGTVLAWGSNDRGQLGTGGGSSLVPVAVPLPQGAQTKAVVAGARHSETLAADGTVLAWGANDRGQLGDTTTTDRPQPVRPALPSGFRAQLVSAGGSQTLALSTDGKTVVTWGAGDVGQLGRGTRTDSATPAEVALPADGPHRVVTAAAGVTFDLVVGDGPPPTTPTTIGPPPTRPTTSTAPSTSTSGSSTGSPTSGTSGTPVTSSSTAAPTGATTPGAGTSTSATAARPSPSGPSTGVGGWLASTGAAGVAGLLLLAVAVVAAGTTLIVLARRRTAAEALPTTPTEDDDA